MTRFEVRTGPNANFRFVQEIGSGTFGEIYRGTNVETGEDIAIKLESIKATQSQLDSEAKMCRLFAGGVGVPNVHWYGSEGNYNVMVMDLLGPSLDELLAFCNGRFSLKTVLMLADQMINIVEYLHNRNCIHCNIKPKNLLMGSGKNANQVHIIDFGHAKRYWNPKTQQHIPYNETRPTMASARYASVNVHLGVEPSRRDDLESVGYVLMQFIRGDLPWQGLKAEDKEELVEKIMWKKASTPIEKLCKKFPREFVTYLNYCRSLRFEDTPDYCHLRGLLKDLFFRECYQYDSIFDWKEVKLPTLLLSNNRSKDGKKAMDGRKDGL